MSGGKTDGNRSQVIGGDISMDQEYLGRIDDIEQQNAAFRLELEKMETKREAEAQRADLYQKEMEKLHHRIAELEMFNQESENLVGEK